MTSAEQEFERYRPELLALAYRMLGDFQRAEDLVQDTWLRFSSKSETVRAPKPYLLKAVTRLCLNELGSARVRREQLRADRLPEPIDLNLTPLAERERLDELSMAVLVLLQRLIPAERAVLLLHDVLDFSHAEIASLLGKNEAHSRQLLRRARTRVAEEKRTLQASPDEHRTLLRAFVEAARSGDKDELLELLSNDVVLAADAGPTGGYFGRVKNLGQLLVGADKVAAFLVAGSARGPSEISYSERELNGQTALTLEQQGRTVAVVMIAVAAGRITRIFMQADPEKLRRLHVGVASRIEGTG